MPKSQLNRVRPHSLAMEYHSLVVSHYYTYRWMYVLVNIRTKHCIFHVSLFTNVQDISLYINRIANILNVQNYLLSLNTMWSKSGDKAHRLSVMLCFDKGRFLPISFRTISLIYFMRYILIYIHTRTCTRLTLKRLNISWPLGRWFNRHRQKT